MSGQTPRQTVVQFWRHLDSRDYRAAGALFDPDRAIDFVLSGERMLTDADWVAVQEHYSGEWRATIQSIVADGPNVVTVTAISGGTERYIAIAMFNIVNGQITTLAEYWPETCAAPDWRKQSTVPIPATESGGSPR